MELQNANLVNDAAHKSVVAAAKNHSFQDYGDLTCYDKRDMFPMIKFLFHLSSTMHYVVITIAVFGILLNVIGAYILASRKSMKNTFNRLLISLYSIDSLFLSAYIYINLTLTYVKTQHPIYTILSKFVKIFYSFAFKCSIFVTVGTAHERYIAMLYPATHIANISSGRNLCIRLLKYLIPISLASTILIIPEYLENELIWELRNSSDTQKGIGGVNGR